MIQAHTTPTGYCHPDYAGSLSEFGTPLQLKRCEGWILKRLVPGSADYDGMGCYPVFTCQHWPQLADDLNELGNELVTLAMVTDPFGDYEPAYLAACFPDVVFPFKEHFVVELGRPLSAVVSNHHERNARKALERVEVVQCENPATHLDEWQGLYANLIQRHAIRGIAAFSRASFERQLHVPGLIAFRAVHQGTTAGMVLWLQQGEVAYYHLAAYSDQGYELRASFALFWRAIEHFTAEGLKWLSLGAGAGTKNQEGDGLARFKAGWSTGRRTAYFCGRVFDPERYREMLRSRGVSGNGYFPAYRKGEFA